jgi:hypothetical protein
MSLDKLKQVPLYVNVDGNVMTESSFYDCSFVLLEVIPRNLGNGWTMVMQGKGAQWLFCVFLSHLQVTACYLETNTNIASASPYLALSLSRIQYGPDLVPYNVHRDEEIIKYSFHMTTPVVNRSNRLFSEFFEDDKLTLSKPQPFIAYCKSHYPTFLQVMTGKRELPVLKVSAQHLRHVSIHELRAINIITILRRCFPILPMIEHLINIGAHEAMISGLLVWAAVLDGNDRTLFNYCGIWSWRFTSISDFATKIKKDFSLRLKAIQNTVKYDLSNFFEFEVLTNRGMGEVDWSNERTHRVDPNVTTFRNTDIYEKACEIFQSVKATGRQPTRQRWTKFWDQRWKWAPTGSYHSQYQADDKYRANERTLRHKLYTLCAMPRLPYEYFSKRIPECRAWPSTKYEWGKQRAIYGVDLTNFIMSSFGMLGAEDLLSSTFPIGPAATTDNVSRHVKEVLKNGLPFCFDFEDFNSQHTNEHMATVLYAYIEVFGTQLDPEQVYAIEWTAAAIANTYIKDPTSNWYKTQGTLMSGWRLTTFMNTMLNKIYVSLCDKQSSLVTIHNGDDVLAAVTRFDTLQQFMKRCRQHNVRFQTSKCYLAAIAEFLRVDHKANKGSGTQYLARGVATFVHGPTETVIPNDLRAVLQANHTRANEILARGANPKMVEMLMTQINKHLCRLWHVSEHDLAAILTTHQVFGGVAEEITPEADKHNVEVVECGSRTSEEYTTDASRFFPGALDYAKQLCSTLIDHSMLNRVYSAVKKSIVHNSIMKRFTLRVKKQHSDAISYLKMQRSGTLRGKFSVAKADLARAYNVPLYLVGIEATQLEQMLAYETDKLEALRVLL